MKTKIKSPANTKYCSYCDKTGIVHNPYFKELGETPLNPCPKCVISKCKCGNQEPYYYYDGSEIKECFCREINMKIDRIKKIYNRSGIDIKYQWKFLNDFESINKQSSDAKNAAYDIARSFKDAKKGLFLWGNPGTGKTLLSAIILTELIIRNALEGRYIKISRTFFNRLKSTFVIGSKNYGKSSEIEKELSEVDILVVDDFGVQRDSEWEQETLYNLVDARYEAEKFTIFTSNNNPIKHLKDLSNGRVLSRIKEMCRIMEISGKDYRDKL